MIFWNYLKMPKQIRFYFSPYFVSKFYLLKDIELMIKKYQFKGSILDIGCGQKPYQYLFKKADKYLGIDFKNYSINKDYKGLNPDLHFSHDYLKTSTLNFDDESFDHTVSFQVMEHHKNPAKMISEMARITKKGGYIMISVPFLAGLHEEPNDYQRFTKYGLIELFKRNNCRVVKIKEQGSLFSTISLLLNENLNNFAGRNKLAYIVSAIIYLPFLVFEYLSLILDKIFKSDKIYFNYLILAEKK